MIAGSGRLGLTPREIEVLGLIADGLTNAEIGAKLWIAAETVKTHVKHILIAMNAKSRAHAVAIGFQRGIIS